jgi:LytS/YehU family sensor histidine kinase
LLILILFQYLLYKIINHYNNIAKEKKLKEKQQQVEYVSLKQQAFTSLMNPHFIFNALNSVQHFVNKQDRLSANKYLSDFATLIRKNFDAAQKSFVSLEEELETIRLYLELEKMRFLDKFDYEISLSEETQDEEWMLPSMVLQPYLENAIIHGLMPLTSKGLLTIHASVKKQVLQICITDNGVGMEKSKLYKTNKLHVSRGMHLIKERLEMLSQLGSEPIVLEITPLKLGEENEGTMVKLSFPLSNYFAYQRQTNSS